MDDDFLASALLELNEEELEAFYEALKEEERESDNER